MKPNIKQKKAIEQKPDRTIFNISDQPNLNAGTLMETIKQLPGLISSDVAGMMYQGKQLEVFLDGRPLNISSAELNSFDETDKHYLEEILSLIEIQSHS